MKRERLSLEPRGLRLSAAQKDMLRSLRKGPQLAARWDFSGSRVPGQLMSKGLVRRCDHPTVEDRRFGGPADAYELTDAGRGLAEDL